MDLSVAQDGEYTVYLGTPNVPFQISGSAVSPSRARYLPLQPAPLGHEAPCNSMLLAGCAVSLTAGVHRLEFGPAANSCLRLVVELRAPVGVARQELLERFLGDHMALI